MSTLVMPEWAGLGLKITREPFTEVNVLTSLSGRELRSTWQTQPRYRYKISVDFARANAATMEFQQLVNFFARMFGRYDSFLFTDPDDNTATLQCFGIGDASTTIFQLQRSTMGDIYDATGGPWYVPSAPRTNLCLYSQDLTNGVWTKSHIAGGPHTLRISPIGDLTADEYTSSSGPTFGSISQTVAGLTAGANYVASVWARKGSAMNLKIGVTEGTSAATTLTDSWQRLTYQFTAASTSTVFVIGDASSWSSSKDLVLWGATIEGGPYCSDQTKPSQYIATTSAAVTVNPTLWPTIGHGYEPIYDPRPGAGASPSVPVPTIYQNGTAKTPTTHYSIDTKGKVTFVSAPASGDVLQWSGTFYRRARLASEGLSSERIVQNLYKTGSVELISVRP